MSLGVKTEIIKDTGTPALFALQEQTRPSRLQASVGPAVNKLTQQHLTGLGTNKRGWPSTHFWADARRSTHWRPEGSDAVVVGIAKIGVRQRYHGGHIAPVNKGALTIPLTPDAYGHVASDFPGLFLLKTKKGAYLVQHGEQFTAKGNEKRKQESSLKFLFKLVAGVDQEPDPNVLPTDEEYAIAAGQAITRSLKL
jgi:hypothetical protein